MCGGGSSARICVVEGGVCLYMCVVEGGVCSYMCGGGRSVLIYV